VRPPQPKTAAPPRGTAVRERAEESARIRSIK
jgi:hypothetical protein